jgi:hypothetical protein
MKVLLVKLKTSDPNFFKADLPSDAANATIHFIEPAPQVTGSLILVPAIKHNTPTIM